MRRFGAAKGRDMGQGGGYDGTILNMYGSSCLLYINLHQPTLTYINLYQPISTYINLYQSISTYINLYALISLSPKHR